jgi:hypothetical protein
MLSSWNSPATRVKRSPSGDVGGGTATTCPRSCIPSNILAVDRSRNGPSAGGHPSHPYRPRPPGKQTRRSKPRGGSCSTAMIALPIASAAPIERFATGALPLANAIQSKGWVLTVAPRAQLSRRRQPPRLIGQASRVSVPYVIAAAFGSAACARVLGPRGSPLEPHRHAAALTEHPHVFRAPSAARRSGVLLDALRYDSKHAV